MADSGGSAMHIDEAGIEERAKRLAKEVVESTAVSPAQPKSWSQALVAWKPSLLSAVHQAEAHATVYFRGATVEVGTTVAVEMCFEQGGSGTGATQWPSGRSLAQLLAADPALRSVLGTDLRARHGFPARLVSRLGTGALLSGARVAELGAGLGLVAAVAARLGARVVATDGEQGLIEQLQRNLDANAGVDAVDGGERARAMELPWGDGAAIDAVRQQLATMADCGAGEGLWSFEASPALGCAEVLLVADCVFGADRGVHELLLATILALSNAATLLLLAHKPRYPTERRFFRKLAQDFDGWVLPMSPLSPQPNDGGGGGGDGKYGDAATAPSVTESLGAAGMDAADAGEVRKWWSEPEHGNACGQIQLWVMVRRLPND